MHRFGKGKNAASVLKYHGKMWYNFAVPHFAVPNFAPANPRLESCSVLVTRASTRQHKKIQHTPPPPGTNHAHSLSLVLCMTPGNIAVHHRRCSRPFLRCEGHFSAGLDRCWLYARGLDIAWAMRCSDLTGRARGRGALRTPAEEQTRVPCSAGAGPRRIPRPARQRLPPSRWSFGLGRAMPTAERRPALAHRAPLPASGAV